MKIAFYFPYLDVGGVSVLFLRVARHLALDHEVFIMDMKDGYMHRNMPAKCRFIPFDRPEQLPAKTTVVMQSCKPWTIPKCDRFPRSIKVLFWNLHPDNFYSGLVPIDPERSQLRFLAPFINLFSGLRKHKLRKTISYLQKQKSLWFMDGENYDKTRLKLEFESVTERYLPIMTDDEQAPVKASRNSFSAVKCLWIGRMEGFKVPILVHLIKRLNNVSSMTVELCLVGEIRDEKINEAIQSVSFDIKTVGELPFDQLDEFVQQHDIMFAMGTSALEAAKNGLPTFCLDYSFTPIQGLYKFRLITDFCRYIVAEEIEAKHLEISSSLESKLSKILDDYELYSQLCHTHWREHHSPEHVLPLLLAALEESTAEIGYLVDQGLTQEDIFTRALAFIWRPSRGAHGFISR